MERRNEGHPVGAMLLLCSMFAFALVFHAVTAPNTHLPARFDAQLAALAMPAISETPSFAASVADAPASLRPEIVAAVVETPIAAATAPLLDASAPATLALLPATVSSIAPGEPAEEAGAVTRAVATTRAALRKAFRKTF